MSELDVRELASETLPEKSFPVSAEEDFRLHLSPQVQQGIFQHAKQDTSIEICGVLVGVWCQDENGPYAVVEDYIRCENATSKFAEVTFTHESWAQINEEMDSRFEDKRIVGWYHSHPDFGIFLSDRDCFIHEHFFSGPGQVAYVVDPVRELEGVFAWRNNKPTAISYYWIGNSICTVQASSRNPAAEAVEPSTQKGLPQDSTAISAYAADSSILSLGTTVLSCLALFLLGYLLSGWQSSWERRAIVDGVVSNYTNFKLVRIGLRDELAEMEKFLDTAARQLQAMPSTTEGLTPEQLEELSNDRKMIVSSLLAIRQRLYEVGNRYGYSDEERLALMRLSKRLEAERQKLLKKAEEEATAAKAPPPEEGDPPSSADDTESSPEPPVDPATETSTNELKETSITERSPDTLER